MTRVAQYRETLRTMEDWEPYLEQESGLPGPRGNLELAQAVAEEGQRAIFERLLSVDAGHPGENTPETYVVFCGVLGLGRLLADGDEKALARLWTYANDERWRIREGVAMALQHWGDRDTPALLAAMRDWSQGSLLEKRAAAAALCEPRLLQNPGQVIEVLRILDAITASIQTVSERRTPEFQALRKGLAYCWSVAAAALPREGKAVMEKWFSDEDRDIRWIMRENLKKKRLERCDPAWTAHWLLILTN